MSTKDIKLDLTVKPSQLTMSERQRFSISITASNQGKDTVDPELGRAQLFVNDKMSKAWSLAIGNGKREQNWFSLPPGETVSMTWSSLGESLFPNPGCFELVLRYDDNAITPLQVEVTG